MIEKTQIVRLIDVFVLGPFLIYAASRVQSKNVCLGLVATGVATILYNGRNYIEYRQKFTGDEHVR